MRKYRLFYKFIMNYENIQTVTDNSYCASCGLQIDSAAVRKPARRTYFVDSRE